MLCGMTLMMACAARSLIPDMDVPLAAVTALGEYGFFILCAWSAVGFVGKKELFLPLATAFVGIGFIGDALFVLARLVVEPDMMKPVTSAILLIQLFGLSQALSETLDIERTTASCIAVGFFIGIMSFMVVIKDLLNAFL